MGIEYRDELVGKRFLCVSGPGKLKISKICEWNWRAGIIRAVDKNGGTTGTEAATATIYVEFDTEDWTKREWLKIHGAHQAFLVEKTIVFAQRVDPYSSRHSTLLWPALNFEPLVDRVGVKQAKQLPVEFFVDKHLGFVPRDEIKPFQEDSPKSAHQQVFNRYPDVKIEVDQWLHDQQVHDILMKAPYSLTGYRVQVYRRGSTTQWFSAVITGHDLYTRELVVMDDTVLESHTENPAHVQMMFLDDVVNSLLKGENVGITPRRRVNASNATQTTNATSFTRPVPRSHSPSHASTQQNQGTSKTKNEPNAGGGGKKKRPKLTDVPEQQEEKEKEKEKKEKPEKETKEKPVKERPTSHKPKKERKRKPEEKPIEEPKKTQQTPPKRPRSQSVSSEELQEREKEEVKKEKAHKTRAKSPEKDKEEKKEEKREKRSDRRSDKHSDKQSHKSEKPEKEKSKHHKHHKSRKHNNEEKPDTKDGHTDTATEGVEKSRHKSKHKHRSSKHKKDEAVVPPPVTFPPTPAESTSPNAVNTSGNAGDKAKPPRTTAETVCVPLVKTSSASETVLTSSIPRRVPISVVPSVATVASIVRSTAATLEGVILTELKRDSGRDNGKIRLNEDSQSINSPAAENSRRYPVGTHANVQARPQVTLTVTTPQIYTKPKTVTSSTSIQLSSATSNCITNCTTTNTSVVSSASSHWGNPTPNSIQAICRTSNAISPILPGIKPPVVTVSGIVKSEDIKRTLPVTSEGVKGHKPKEREKDSVSRLEPVNLSAAAGKDILSEQNLHQIAKDFIDRGKEITNRDLENKATERIEGTDERPLASTLREPIQVYRDPNLSDIEVIHVNSVQHQLAYQHHQQAASADRTPPPTHTQLAAVTQHSTLHPTSTLSTSGIGASPSAFVPSAAAAAGRIPSHHPLAHHPMFSPHVQAIYQHPLAQAAGHIPAAAAYGSPSHIAVINQHDMHARHIAGLVHQESLARLHHPGVFAQLQHAATAAAALQGMHPGMSAAQLQQLWQQQQAAGMPIPPTWILQQHHDELEQRAQHLHQQQQAAEKLPSVAHAAVAASPGHHDKPRTPQPAPGSHQQRELAEAASRESSVRHYAEFPPSDAQAAVQRHFQESLRKLHLPYSFNTSPGGASGSITAGTAIPKTEPGQSKEQGRQSKDRIEAEERLRKEREKELEWVRLQREKHQQQQQHRDREADLRLQPEKAGPMSHLERERYNKLHTSEVQVRSREDSLYRHQQEVHQRHLETERLRQLEKDRQMVSVKQEPGVEISGRTSDGGHNFQMFQNVYYGNMRYEETRAGAPAGTEHGKQLSGASQIQADSLIGYQPFRHAIPPGAASQGEIGEHIKTEDKLNQSLMSRTSPHRPIAVNAAVLAGKARKDIPTPPPLIHRDESGQRIVDPAAQHTQHTSVIQGRDRRDMHPATTIALGAPPHSVVASQVGKLPQEVDLSRTVASENAHNVPVIVQHGGGIGNPPPLHSPIRVSPLGGSRTPHTSPGGGASHQQQQQLSTLHKQMQPVTTAPSHSSHQQVYSMAYTSPTATTSNSLLLTALRPGEGGRAEAPSDGQSMELPPGKRKPEAPLPANDPNRSKKSKKANELPNTNSSSKPSGRLSYGDYYQSFVMDSRNSQFTGGSTAPEPLGREVQQSVKNQENVELKIEKVDQYKKMSLDSSAPVAGTLLGADILVHQRLNNGALSDSDSTRSCSPKATGSESSEGRSVKTGSPNRHGGGHVNLKKKWLIRHAATAIPPAPGLKLANSSTALDLKNAARGQESPESMRLSHSLPNGHLQPGVFFQQHDKSEKGPSSVTLADIPKSIPDHVYDFDNSSTCSESSTTSSHKSKKRGREAKARKKHRHKRGHEDSKHHKDKNPKGEKKACLDAEGTKALSKDRDTKMTDEGRQPVQDTQLQNFIDMMNSGGYKAPKKLIVTRARKEKEKDVLNVSRALVKPSIAKLKKTGEPFLQDGACCEVTPNLMKCRECRIKPSSKQSKINIFCRFYAFRRLRYSKNGNLTIAGFSEPDQCEQEDLAPWLPFPPDPGDNKCLDRATSRYILEKVGDQFCQLVSQEEEAKSWNTANGPGKVAWKRAVTGVREMCDTCDTTLFNIHWTCQKCGFVVCLDCYRTRKTGTAKVPKDKQSWLRCIKEQPHMPENLMLTQIIPGNALWDVGLLVHKLRMQLNIQSACKCKWSDQTKSNSQLLEKLPAVNGVSPMMKENQPVVTKDNSPTDGKEMKLTSFPPTNSSPLNMLADVAASTQPDSEHAAEPTKYSFDQQTHANTKAVAVTTDSPSDADTPSKSSTLRELLTKTAGKLGRPPPNISGLDGSSFLTAFLPSKSESVNKKQFGTMTSTFEDIIATVVEQNISTPVLKHDRLLISRTARNYHGQQTVGYPSMPNNPSLMLGPNVMITPSSVRHTLTETSVLYPDVPHSWLQDGRLLRLHDPQHRGNFRIFQEQWTRGEPVLVSSLHKTLNELIWDPQWFGNKFGEVTNDLVNCLTGSLIQGHQMKDFWDGFNDLSNRLVTKQGEPMSLKLKDWPPTEDFAEILPEHFQDLMQNLPLPEYSRRDGKLNLSSRLPDFFVKPDLGPKMYNAYGNCQYPELGTTNLHLDISDAVNVMVHVAIPKGDPDLNITSEHLQQEGIKIVESACTDEQTRRRIRIGKEKVGALWHIFRADDAVKIRELLNKVARERGEDIPDDHDPIHDQSWYLDKELLERLYKEHGVQGWAIAQCHGDAVFIPGGAPHQVQNLQSCIKVAEDFVSPEHITQCFNLTQEFRKLSDTHTNHEDKLQIKNMIYHAVKDAAGVLFSDELPSPNATSQ